MTPQSYRYQLVSDFFTLCRICSVLFLCFGLFIFQNVHGSERVHFGLEAGGGFILVDAKKTPWVLDKQEAAWGFSGGGFFEIDISKRWYARIELLAHAGKIAIGGTSKDTSIGNLTTEIKFTKISAPLEIGIQCLPLNIPVKLSFFAGISPTFSQSANTANCTIGRQNGTFSFANVALGLQGGLCLEYRFVSILARYEYTPTISFKVDTYSFKHNGLSLLLRFKLF